VLDQKDGKNNAILTYGYDALARVMSSTDALSNVTSFTYDGTGNRLTQQDPGGNCSATPKTGCTTTTYDTANQLKTVAYSDGVTPNVTNLTYDADGQRTGMTDGTGTSAWVWDSFHRLTGYSNGNGAQVQYGYNLRNLPTTITYPGSLNVTRGYDDVGRFTSVQDWLSNTTTFGYDPNSNLTTETLPSGAGIVDTFTFDAADRLTGISDVKGSSTTLFSATYTRDNANQLSSDSSAPSATGSYKYTPLNQVCYAGSSGSSACGSPPSGSTAYAYDAADNLIQTGTTQQVFNNGDQLCWTAPTVGACASPPTGATTYTYEAHGNRTVVTPPAGGATNLSYDQANRLTAVGTSSTYAYNGDGLRMSKTISGTTSQFLWDVAGSLPVLIRDSSTLYIHGPGGQPVEQINGSTVIWLHHDQLGSTRLITDANGVSQATYTFDAYGTIVLSTGAISNPMRFAGEYRDPESGFYYLRARYYDPSTSQLISRDPAVQGTGEPYGYVDDNPLNATDPTGLLTWNDLRRVVRGVGGLPSAVVQAGISQVTSFDSLPIYGGYYFSYSMNKRVVPQGWTPVRVVFSHAQRVFLGYDETLDEFQRVAGYPGGRVDDEGIPVTPIPSLIFPTVDSGGNWRMNKWSSTLWQTAGPGCHNGREDFAD
jgi:RHS repeat-associated protein